MAPKCGLENTVKKLQNKTRLSTEEEKKEIFDYLNSQLSALGLEGTVQTLLVYDAHGKINCYGQRIDSSILFQQLNMTIGTSGTKVTGKVSYPEPHHVDSYQKGYFVSGKTFGQKNKTYIALVNIPINFRDSEVSAHRYP